MSEKIFWGIASLNAKNYEVYISIERQYNPGHTFSFHICEKNVFIRSTYSLNADTITYTHMPAAPNSYGKNQFFDRRIQILDNENSISFLTDTFGLETLYWSSLDGGIIFSNSSYFLAKLLGKSPLGIEGLFFHLILRGQQNDKSYFEDIYQIPPQSILKLDKSGINISKRELSTASASNFDISRLLLKNLNSDVAINAGICFSGGIDSSVIVKEFLNKFKDVSCYSLVNSRNENLTTDLSFAYKLAQQQHFNIHHVPFEINKEIVYHDMPILDHDVYGQYCLAQAMINDRKQYMICGTGADELFGGYDRIFHYAYELSIQNDINSLNNILQRYSYTDFHLLKRISEDLFTDVYRKIEAYYRNITDISCDLVVQLHHWFIYHHLFWILKMHPRNLICIYPYLQEEFLSFSLRTDYRYIFPFLTVEPNDTSYHSKVKEVIKRQYAQSLPSEILNRPKLPFSVQEQEIIQWYELQYTEKHPDYLVPTNIFTEIMDEKYGSQTKLLFLSYILWRQRVL